MKIVFLDASTVDRGDIDFSALEAEGELVRHATTKPQQAAARCADADIILSNKVPVGDEVLDAAPNLKLVVSTATGVNQIDLEACRACGVAVANVAGYSTPSVAQHVFALLLELATRAARYAARIAEDWPASPIFTRLDHPLVELAGKTLGIVGLGDIGSAVARIGAGFDMRVVALAREGSTSREGSIPRLPEAEFLPACDVVTLHCPLTAETERFIDARRLAAMKPGAFLINTGRGQLVDEAALIDALRSGQLGGAGLDVLSVEPPPPDHPLFGPHIPNLLITPHSAWSTRESRTRLMTAVVENIRSINQGGSLNRIV